MASKFPEKFSQHIAELCGGLAPSVGPLGERPLLAIMQVSVKRVPRLGWGEGGIIIMGGYCHLGEAKGKFPEESPFPQRTVGLASALRACLGDCGAEWKEMLIMNPSFLPCCFISEFFFLNSISFWLFQAYRKVVKIVQRMLIYPSS